MKHNSTKIVFLAANQLMTYKRVWLIPMIIISFWISCIHCPMKISTDFKQHQIRLFSSFSSSFLSQGCLKYPFQDDKRNLKYCNKKYKLISWFWQLTKHPEKLLIERKLFLRLSKKSSKLARFAFMDSSELYVVCKKLILRTLSFLLMP